MYEVYADSYLMYSDNISNLKIFNPKVELELNKTGSFECTIWQTHPYYSYLKKLKTIIKIYQDDYLLFKGRILNDELGFHNEKFIECEGCLAFLIDSVVRPYDYTGSIEGFLQFLIHNHNSQTESEKHFTLGNVTVTDRNNYITRSSVDSGNTWDVINDKLIKLLGGYISVRFEGEITYIDYLEDFTLLSPQKVEFAKNLLDMKISRKGADIKTVIIPYGAKLTDSEGNETDERLTIADVNGGLDYIVDEDAVAAHGWIWTSEVWDDVTVASNLLTKGNERLATLVSSADTLELSAADLATIDKTVSSFHLGTYVEVTSNPHGIDQHFLVSKLSINLLNAINNKLTLGGKIESFTEQSWNNIGKIQSAKGAKGEKGTSSYLHIRYSANEDGSSMTEEPQDDTEYIGVATTTSSIAPDKAESYTWSKIKGEQGSPGEPGKDGTPGADGAAGKGISSITEYYLASASASGVTTSTSGWSTTIPTITATNKYLWNYEVIKYTDNTSLTIAPVIIGAYGNTGATGAAGKGISSITEYYLASASASGVTTSTSGWTTAIQTITTSKKYLWNYEVVTYTDNSTTTTTPVIIGVYGNTGATGAAGANGKDAAVQSETAPSDTSYMWLDISLDPPLLKRYNGTEWVIVNDTTETIAILEQNMEASIQENANSILASVGESYYLKDDTDAMVQEVKTEVELVKDSFEITFTEFNADLEAIKSGTDAEFEEIKKYIRFSDGKILLGEIGNELELQIANDRISFLQDGAEVAYFSDRKLYVTDGEYTNSLQLGSFAFVPRDNGNLSFKKIT